MVESLISQKEEEKEFSAKLRLKPNSKIELSMLQTMGMSLLYSKDRIAFKTNKANVVEMMRQMQLLQENVHLKRIR